MTGKELAVTISRTYYTMNNKTSTLVNKKLKTLVVNNTKTVNVPYCEKVLAVDVRHVDSLLFLPRTQFLLANQFAADYLSVRNPTE